MNKKKKTTEQKNIKKIRKLKKSILEQRRQDIRDLTEKWYLNGSITASEYFIWNNLLED